MEFSNFTRILSNYQETITSFSDLQLKDDILRCLNNKGYLSPSTIQSQAILPILQGKDTIAQGQAGSGKTTAFIISILQKINRNVKTPQALILVPTRELALQVKEMIISIGEYLRYSVRTLIGGHGVNYEKNKLRKNAQIIVGTPGRVADHLSRGNINIHMLDLLVLDEADELLGKNFKEKVKEVLQSLRPDLQVALFCTKLSSKCLESTKTFMKHPVVISTKYKELLAKNIKQYHIDIETEENRSMILSAVIEKTKLVEPGLKYIIYCNQKKGVESVDAKLKEEKEDVISIHGDMSQEERCSLLKEFQSGSHRVLVTTDSILRGIHIPEVKMVISYDTPLNTDHYIQRAGRVGRFGKEGISVCFVLGKTFLEDIKKYCDTEIPMLPYEMIGVFDSNPEAIENKPEGWQVNEEWQAEEAVWDLGNEAPAWDTEAPAWEVDNAAWE